MMNPLSFMRQVRQEIEKVVWPSRRETLITTAMVLVMVALASLFFLGVDAVLSNAVRYALRLGL